MPGKLDEAVKESHTLTSLLLGVFPLFFVLSHDFPSLQLWHMLFTQNSTSTLMNAVINN